MCVCYGSIVECIIIEGSYINSMQRHCSTLFIKYLKKKKETLIVLGMEQRGIEKEYSLETFIADGY